LDERGGEGHSLPVLSVTKHQGIVRADTYFKKAVHGRETAQYKVVRPGQFAYATIHLDEGSIGRLEGTDAGIVSPMYTVFQLRADIDPTFLLAALKSAGALACYRTLAQGTVNRRASIPFSALGQLRLFHPPLAEQRKIAAILSSLDDTAETTEAVIAQLQVMKKSMMEELLTRGMPGRHNRFRETDIGKVPIDWQTKPCGEVFEVQLGKMMSAAARSGENSLPYLRNENVYWNRLELGDVAKMSFDAKEREKFRLKPGDLLVCEGRHIGRCALWAGELDECYYQKALHRIRTATSEVSTSYMQLFMTLRFRFMQDLVGEVSNSTTIPHLPRERLMRLPIHFPPKREQEEIEEALSAVQLRERAECEKLRQLGLLKESLGTVLLRGEVRVARDEGVAA
jgi:type I restriction enzyme S subunit